MSDNTNYGTPSSNDQSQTQTSSDEVFYVRLLSGKSMAFKVDPNMTGRQLKEEIMKQESINVDQQRLIYQGKQIEDDDTLGSFSIGADANIHLVLRLKGGE